MPDVQKSNLYRDALEAFEEDVAQLDSATAHAVIEEARELARSAWLRWQIQQGEDSGEPVDGPATMARLRQHAQKRLNESPA